MYDLYDLYDLAHVGGWEPYDLHDLGHVSWDLYCANPAQHLRMAC